MRISTKWKTYLLGTFILFCWACDKEEPAEMQDQAPQSLWLKFQNSDHPFKTKTLIDPPATDVDRFVGGERVSYDFYVDNPIYPRLQVEVENRVREGYSGPDTLYSVYILMEEAISWKRQDWYLTTFKNSGLTAFPEFDSAYQLSHDSPMKSPFSDTLDFEEFESIDTYFFEPGDSIDLLADTLIWSRRADDNNILSHFHKIGFYPHRNHLFVIDSDDDPNWYALHHDYHRGIMGQGPKVFVFRWMHRDLNQYFYGWMVMSLTEEREFSIHKLVYQLP